MKLHINTVEAILTAVRNLGGNQNNQRLKEFISRLPLTIYTKKDGTPVLVETERLLEELRKIGQEPLVGALYFHESVVSQVLKLEELYSGYSNESKLKTIFSDMDFTPYDRKYSEDTVLVLTSDYQRALEGR